MKKIPLTQGKFSLVDKADYEHLSQWKWHITSSGYAARWDYSLGYKNPKMIRMHRVLNKTPDGMDTDHINGDKLDNRKKNLRSATRNQNCANLISKNLKNNKYKGVARRVSGKRWQAQIRFAGGRKALGSFGTPEEAALAYNAEAIKIWGQFAKLNEVKNGR